MRDTLINNTDRVRAVCISRIFDPVVVFSIVLLVGSLRSGMTREALMTFLMVFVFLMVLPPVGFLLWAVKTKRVSDIDVSDRKQRIRVLFVFGLFLLIDYFVIKSFGNISFETLFTSLVLWFIGFFIITLFWKISGHMSGLTLALGLFFGWYGSLVLPFFFLIPIVAWARIVTKNHSPSQVIAGILYSVFFLYETRISFF